MHRGGPLGHRRLFLEDALPEAPETEERGTA